MGEHRLLEGRRLDLSLSQTGRRDTPALEWRGGTFTFGELDARSNQVAHLLAGRDLRMGGRLWAGQDRPALAKIKSVAIRARR